MNITDKELLAICNLSNLKMEFANLADKVDDEGNILSNHTIYSLLDKEYKRLKENLALTEENVSFYQMDDNKNILPEYKDFKELRKTAPIVMEYYDRYRESGKSSEHEGAFLDDWEIIYSADLYQMIIDYSYDFYKKISKDISENILTKEEFIADRKISSREKLKGTQTVIEIINIIKEIFLMKEYKNFSLDMLKTIIEKSDDIQTVLREDFLENLTEEKFMEIKNATLLFNAILRDSDFKIIILKHKINKNFVIVINDFDSSDKIAVSLRDGKLNIDLHILNQYLLSKLKTSENINITYTGYGVGAQVALYMNGINPPESETSARVFTGKEEYAYNKIINFDIENAGVVLENFEVVCRGFTDTNTLVLKLILESIESELKATAIVGIINFFFPSTVTLGVAGISSFIGLLSIIKIGVPVIILLLFKSEIDNYKNEKIYKKLKEFKIISQKGDYNLVNKRFLASISMFDKNISNKKYYSINIEDKIFNLPKELIILLCTHNYYLNKSTNNLLVCRDISKNLSENRNVTFSIQFDDNNNFKSLSKRILKFKLDDKIANQVLQENANINLALQDITSIVEDTKETIFRQGYNEVLKIEEISQEINISNLLTEIGYLQQSMNFNTFSLKKAEIIYMDKVPKITSKLNEVKYIKSSSFVYFPFISTEGMLVEEIRKEYIGTILRSLYGMRECKYDTLEHIENIHSTGNYISPSNSRTCSDVINIELQNRILNYGLKRILKEHRVAVKSKLSNNIDFLNNFYVIEEDKDTSTRGTMLIGILNDKKNNYAKDKIGFIYNSEDDLYGCILEEKLYFTEKSLLEEISTTGVCDGAILSCSGGTITSSLKVTSQNLEETDGNLLATEKDYVMNINISPFGDCKLCGDKDKSCIKHWNLGKWGEVSIGQEIDGKKILINTSKLECRSMKGIISIINSKTSVKDN